MYYQYEFIIALWARKPTVLIVGWKRALDEGKEFSFTSPTFGKSNFANKCSYGDICLVAADENQVVRGKEEINIRKPWGTWG